jgi:Arc/MetJ-type ribon-helix-helix transcriptional regulator
MIEVPTLTKSIRLSQKMYDEIERLQGKGSFNRVVRAALKRWLRMKKRQAEDTTIERALASQSPEQIAEEEAIVRESGASARRVLKETDL